VRTLFRGRVHGMRGEANGVLVERDRVIWVGEGRGPERPDEVIVAGPGELIGPGFIDLQVNGFGGHDAATGPEAIAAISAALPSTGVTAFLPTLISAPLEVGAAFVAAAAAAAASGARVLGAHVEGPFLNPSFRGAHLRACLIDPTPPHVDAIVAARPRLVTLAPELPGGLEAISRLHRAGIVVSAGHTGADFELGRRAIAAGVRFATHLYNAMPPVHHRRPGIALALLLDPKVTVGLIADGEHVHPAVCRQLVRAAGATRIALTTDQTSAAGVGPGQYSLAGRPVVSDGIVVRLEDGTLAGSAATMEDLVRLMAGLPGMTASRAISLASTVPARVLGERSLGRVRVGAYADLVVLDADLRVRLTMVGGQVKYRAEPAARAQAL
jgi:N-acetylglucosamine-6-phosphate deacetylase